MAAIEFSLDDVTSLIEKISALQPDLSDQELVLLMSIFTLAAEHTMPADALREPPGLIPPPTVEDLKQQLLHAFSPDDGPHGVTRENDAAVATYSIHRHAGSIHR